MSCLLYHLAAGQWWLGRLQGWQEVQYAGGLVCTGEFNSQGLLHGQVRLLRAHAHRHDAPVQ